MSQDAHGIATQWECRLYKDMKGQPGADAEGFVRDEQGKILNPLVWEDPKISSGKNFNLTTNVGKQLMFNTIFQLAGSAFPVFFAVGASSTAAALTDVTLKYEHILDGTRPRLTNSAGTALTNASVTVSAFSDAGYTPSYNYSVAAVVMGTIPAATLNLNQPIQEIGLATLAACPTTPTGTSGILFNHYVFGSPTLMDGSTIFQAVVTFHY